MDVTGAAAVLRTGVVETTSSSAARLRLLL
jgi:hypothetical protein